MKEVRTIRPFAVPGVLARALGGSVLHFGDLSCPADSSISLDLDPHTYAMRPVHLEWAPNEEEFEAFKGHLTEGVSSMDVSPAALSLVVEASTPYLKRVDLVLAHPLSEIEGLERVSSLTDRRRAAAFEAGHHGCVVDAFVLLNQDVERRALRPWRKGTWLARVKFALTTDIARAMFRPFPLDDETRDRLGLPAKTIRYFDMGDHDPLEPYDAQPNEPVLYVDEDLLAELTASSNTPASIGLQLQLALDFIAAVVHDASRREALEDLSLADLEDSLLGRVLRVTAGSSREDDQKILLGWVRSDPGKVVAKAEHTIDLQKRLIESLHGDDV